MDKLGALLFELSSDERMTILSSLSREALKLSHLAQRQDMAVTETSRHLQRLTETDLILKDSEGLYRITNYGRLVLSLIPALGFVSENKRYLLEHDTSVLPFQFIARFGELAGYTFREDTISNLAYQVKIFSEAEEICWAAANQFHLSSAPVASEGVRRGVDFRSILPEDVVPPPGLRPAEGVHRRTLKDFNVLVIVTDKEASFGLPYLSGKMDYAQFFSKDLSFLNWCRDLFSYYWDRAKPMLGPFPSPS